MADSRFGIPGAGGYMSTGRWIEGRLHNFAIFVPAVLHCAVGATSLFRAGAVVAERVVTRIWSHRRECALTWPAGLHTCFKLSYPSYTSPDSSQAC